MLGTGAVFAGYLQYEYYLAAVQLSLAMAGMGATLGIDDFLQVFRQPRGLFLGIALQLVLVPALALTLIAVLGLGPGLATGLLLVATVPGGSMSNLFTYLGRGNTPLSIALTGVTTLGCLVTTPALLGLLASTHLPADFAMPVGGIVREIAFVLLLPLAVGMTFGHFLPDLRDRFSKWCIRGSLTAIALIVVGSAGSGRVDPGAHGAPALLAMLLLPIAAQVATAAIAMTLRFPPRDVLALAIEVTIRNTNLALLVAASFFPPVPGRRAELADGVFFMALLYGGFALLAAAPTIVVGWRRFARDDAEVEHEPRPASA